MKLSLLKALILGAVIAIVVSQGVPDPTSPTGERPPTEEELELMSQELRRTELQEMSDNAEKLKITLTSPRTNATEKVAAAAELKNIYEKTRFEMYKVSFAESLRLLRKNMNKRASKACSDMGVHREKQSDKYVKRNCKKAVVMAWNLIFDRLSEEASNSFRRREKQSTRLPCTKAEASSSTASNYSQKLINSILPSVLAAFGICSLLARSEY
jgi:hypothetical protein